MEERVKRNGTYGRVSSNGRKMSMNEIVFSQARKRRSKKIKQEDWLQNGTL